MEHLESRAAPNSSLETNRDWAVFEANASAIAKERDTVVHEIGHTVADIGDHPVTDWPAAPPWPTGPTRYVEAYLKAIRETDRPDGP